MTTIKAVRTKLYQWTGPTRTDDTPFTNPLSVLPFQRESQSAFRFFSWLVVEVETTCGTVGLGNAGLCPDLCKQIIDTKLASILVGENPYNTEYLYESMYRSSMAYGRKGAVMAAISALDIALWDIKGQLAGQPVFMLLGGRTKEAIPAYWSRLYTTDLERLAAEAVAAKDAGFRAVKMRFGHPMTLGLEGLHRNVEMVKTVRDAVGDSVDIMAEAYMGFDLPYAKRLLRRLEPYNLRWVEEPLIPDEISLFPELRAATATPISGGEHEFGRWGFKDIIERRALDILQFDVNRVGGFTEAQKVCAMALAHGLEVIPHGGQMHNLQLIMATFASPMAEYFPKSDVEVGNELFWYIFNGEKDAENGLIQLDDTLPGMGLTLSDEHLDSFTIVQ